MRAPIASLAAFFALTACAGSPPESPPRPAERPRAQPTATAVAAPSPCDEAGALLASARSALDEGRLLRARRSIQQASARCPARAAEALPLELRVAALLNDVNEMARLKAAAAGAPSSPALKEALANEAPFGGDVPAGVAPGAKSEDYYRAARAFVDGKLDEAGRGAMSFALSGSGPLVKEAFVLAARVAEASGDTPRANRMFARAFQAACSSGCDAPVTPPREDLFSLAATYPSFRLAGDSCVSIWREGSTPPYPQTLTPDARFYVVLVDHAAEVRAVPHRVLVGRVEQGSSNHGALACFSEGALFTFVHPYDDKRDRVFIGPLGGELRAVKGPHRLWIADGAGGRFQLPRVTPSGTAYVPDSLNWDGDCNWYRAAAGDHALKRFPTSIKHFEPALLPSGEIVGFGKRAKGQDEPLAIFDGTTGKRIRVLGPAPQGLRFVVSADGKRLVYFLRRSEYGLVDLSKEGPGAELRAAAPNPNGWTERLRVVKTPKESYLEGIVDPSLLIVGGEGFHFSVFNPGQGTIEPAGVTAGPIHRAEVRGGRLLVQIGDNRVALYASDGRISHNEPGVSFKEPPAQRAPGWDRMRPLPRCWSDIVGGDGATYLYRCAKDNSIWRDHPDTQAPATRLGELPPAAQGAKLKSWDESEGFFFVINNWDELMIGEILDTRVEGLRIRFAQGAMGGIAIDGKGYYEFFGEVPDAFRKSAACGDTMPIEACADLYETPGMARMFLARDFSYRAP